MAGLLLSRRLKAENWELSLRGGSVVFVGWRRAQRSPTSEPYCTNQSGINMDVAEQ